MRGRASAAPGGSDELEPVVLAVQVRRHGGPEELVVGRRKACTGDQNRSKMGAFTHGPPTMASRAESAIRNSAGQHSDHVQRLGLVNGIARYPPISAALANTDVAAVTLQTRVICVAAVTRCVRHVTCR